MNKIFFEGVRCFHDLHCCSIKPITLLVGENSSGKTTFLALNRIAWDIAQGGLREDVFNEEPFLLGSYDQIASLRGGKAGRSKSFAIGFEIALKSSRARRNDLFGDSAQVSARFTARGSQSTLDEWSFECGRVRVLAKPSSKLTRLDVTITTPVGSETVKERVLFPGWLSITRMLTELRFSLSRQFHRPDRPANTREPVLSDDNLAALRSIAFQISSSLGPRPFAFAPIRSRPKRTYDPVKDVPEPEGSHVPMLLAKTLLDKSNGSDNLRRSLKAFGEASGLFVNVEVKRKGTKDSDPFQIGVKVTGQSFNLLDVGYGVSQVLPILVDVVVNPKRSCFLLQQPEVHLHPKAQAELGSFLAALAKTQDKRFIIETHSDYLIDRIRMDIRDKKQIRSDDVAILYFERSKSGVTIHELELDDFGNIKNAPPSYRQFFLDEERRLLGI